ncbi:MAG: hypothetical protein IJ512_03325 [Ruminococcus sp.]|nr:hypothetical protein [Ruminococcus sp.]
MEKRFAALIAASAAAMIVFVGCSCGSGIENSIDDSNKIVMESDVTVSSAVLETTEIATEAVTEAEKSIKTTATETETTTETTTTGTRAVQFVGRPQGQSPVTAKPQVVTQIVVVTVTVPAATTTEAVTETAAETTVTTTTAPAVTEEPLYTIALPDGIFRPEEDVRFVQEDVELSISAALPDMSAVAEQVTAAMPENGGSAANIYICDGYEVKTEVFTLEDGSTQELVTEILLGGDKVCTTKGVAVGHTTDAIFGAYGAEGWELVEDSIYRFRTEDGRILDFTTENSVITEIRYYQDVQ